MIKKTVYTLAILFLIGISFKLGQIYPITSNSPVTETTPSTNPEFILIEKCISDELMCFGSGREKFMETANSVILNLVATDHMLRYGLIDKNTGELYELTIE